MHPKTRTLRIALITGFLIVLCFGNPKVVAAQEGSKGLLPDEAGIKTNPKRKKTARAITFRTPRPFARRPAPTGTEYAQVGVTILRVDNGQSKGIEQEGEEQIVERLDTNAPYSNGDTVRFVIESPSTGYMYIVDQEQYADGSYGPAMLVFPTSKTRKGNNLVPPWTPVEVPAYPSVWRFKPRELKEGELRKMQTAEVFTIIISPKLLVDRSRISDKQLALDKGEFEGWQAKWQTTIQQFDVENAAGQIVKSTGVERVGDEDDVGAQTTYQVVIKPGNPIFVRMPLRFKDSAPPGAKN